MTTGEIHILPTGSSPEFHFNSDGKFKISGRGLYKSKTDDNEKLMVWVTKYLENPAEVTYVSISFEYLNSMSTLIIVSLLKKIAEVFLQSKKLVINWYYEEDDEDMFERGEYISMTFNIPFTFIPAGDISDE